MHRYLLAIWLNFAINLYHKAHGSIVRKIAQSLKISPLLFIQRRLGMVGKKSISRLTETMQDFPCIFACQVCCGTLAIHGGNTTTIVVEFKVVRHNMSLSSRAATRTALLRSRLEF